MVKKQFRLLNRSILMSELGLRPKLQCWAKMSRNRHEKSYFNECSFWAHEPLRNGKKQFRLLNCSILMSELGVRPKLWCWAKMSMKQARKIWLQGISFWAHESLRNVKKTCEIWNRSIMMSELRVRPKLRCWAKMSRKQTRKIVLQRIQLMSSWTP